MSLERLDQVNGFSKKRQMLSAALFFHSMSKEELQGRLGAALPVSSSYDRIRYYDVVIEEWTLTLTFVGEDPYELYDIMGRHQGDRMIYTWKHVPIQVLKQLADRLGAKESAVRTRFINR